MVRRKKVDSASKPEQTSGQTSTPGFAKCPACGLNQSVGTINANEGLCSRCSEPVPLVVPPPDETRVSSPAKPAPEDDPGAAWDRDFSALHRLLTTKHYEFTLQDIAGWGSSVRKQVGLYLSGNEGTVMPDVLSEQVRAMARAASEVPTNPKGKTVDPNHQRNVVEIAAMGDAQDRVTYEWGKEQFRLAEYCTANIGSAFVTTAVKPGETPADALRRARDSILPFMEEERRRKLHSYLEVLKKGRNAIDEG